MYYHTDSFFFNQKIHMDEHLLHVTAAIVSMHFADATQAQAFDMQIYQLLKCLDDGLQPTNLIWLTMDLPEAAQAHQELEAPLLLVGMPVVIATKKKATPVCDGRCTNACGKCLRERAVQAGERSALALRRGLSGMSPIFKVRARRPHLRSRGC